MKDTGEPWSRTQSRLRALLLALSPGIAIDRSACLDRSIDEFQCLVNQPSIDQRVSRPTNDRPTGLID